MIYTPKKRTSVNVLICLAFLLAFVICVYVTKKFSLPDSIWQGVFFVEAIILCELLTKFFLPIYTYSIDDSSFIITKTLGKSVRTVCNIDLPRIVAVLPKGEYKKQEEYNPRSVYNYNGNIASHSCYVLIFEYSDCAEAVFFEPDDGLVNAIRAWIKSR